MAVLFRLFACIGCVLCLSLFTEDLATTCSDSHPSRSGADTSFRAAVPQASCAVLLRTSEVQEELGIDAEQKNKLDQWLGELEGQLRAMLGTSGYSQGEQWPTDEELKWRLAEIGTMAQEIRSKADQKLVQFLNAPQLERLRQLQLRREGVSAFERPEIILSLELTNNQRQRIRELTLDGFHSSACLESRQAAHASLCRILTEAQQDQWAELRGREFTFAPLSSDDAADVGIMRW